MRLVHYHHSHNPLISYKKLSKGVRPEEGPTSKGGEGVCLVVTHQSIRVSMPNYSIPDGGSVRVLLMSA